MLPSLDNLLPSASLASAREKDTVIKKTKDVLYEPIFEAALLMTDEYWKHFFLDLSKGKQNRKMHIDLKYVSHTSKKASFHYQYDNKLPQQIATELRKLISDTLYIYSDTDMTAEREELNLISSEFREMKTLDDFKKVKNQNMKDHLIINYVMAQKKLHKLSWEQARLAWRTIDNAMKSSSFHTHKSTDINMVNGEIESIDDIIISATEIRNLRFSMLDMETTKDDKEIKKIKASFQPKKASLTKSWESVCESIASRSKALMCIEADDANEKVEVKKKKKSTKATKIKPNSSKAATAVAQQPSATTDDTVLGANEMPEEQPEDDEEDMMEPEEDLDSSGEDQMVEEDDTYAENNGEERDGDEDEYEE